MTNAEIQKLLDEGVTLKKCGRCQEQKILSAFHKNRSTKDGLGCYCKPCARVKVRENYERNGEGIRARQKVWSKGYRDKLRQTALLGYGAACACCGETTSEFLAFDHVEGGGAKHRRETGLRGQELYRWLKANDFPATFRLLCHNCNFALGVYGYCPHHRLRAVV